MADTPIVHVVDDDDAVRDSLTLLLESAGLAART
jgi:FixJ family two-component response regulator